MTSRCVTKDWGQTLIHSQHQAVFHRRYDLYEPINPAKQSNTLLCAPHLGCSAKSTPQLPKFLRDLRLFTPTFFCNQTLLPLPQGTPRCWEASGRTKWDRARGELFLTIRAKLLSAHLRSSRFPPFLSTLALLANRTPFVLPPQHADFSLNLSTGSPSLLASHPHLSFRVSTRHNARLLSVSGFFDFFHSQPLLLFCWFSLQCSLTSAYLPHTNSCSSFTLLIKFPPKVDCHWTLMLGCTSLDRWGNCWWLTDNKQRKGWEGANG